MAQSTRAATTTPRSRLTCFSLERRRRRRDGKKGRAASCFSRPRPRREEAGLEGAKSAKAKESVAKSARKSVLDLQANYARS